MIFQDYANNKTSNIIRSQLPEFIRFNYENFVAFLEAYFEYLEGTGKLTNITKNIQNYLDIDYVVENDIVDFIEVFRNQYLNSIPKNVLADKALLTKHIKEFYTSKGTIKSYKFLFRVMFNENVELFNTGTQVLKASDGKWYQPSVIRIATANNVNDFKNTQINGQDSFATAVVDDTTIDFQNNFQYNELTLSNISKNFLPNEIITSLTEDGRKLYGRILSVIPSITILDPGSRYNIGDPVIITGGGGANASAFISSVTSGSLLAIGIIDGGAGYQASPGYNVTVDGSATPVISSIYSVDITGQIHPNSYKINNNQINPSANITNSSRQIANSLSYITYGNTGPITLIHVIDGGSNFMAAPSISITPNTSIGNTNTIISDYGIIGTFKILNGGSGYKANDDIKFTNITSVGVGAGARVTSVNANGGIISVTVAAPSVTGTANVTAGSNTVIGTNTLFTSELLANNDSTYPGSGTLIMINGETRKVMSITNNTFLKVDTNYINTSNGRTVRLDGFTPGGFGYKQSDFPNGVSLNVVSANGHGAVIVPDSILGAGAVLTPVGSVYGQINSITMSSFGDSYTSAPTVDLTHSGDGLATATAQFIGGVFQYPGRFLNEDGMLSSRRYLQDALKYNGYSYLLTSPVASAAYYDLVYSILNPIGSHILPVTNICPFVQPLTMKNQVYINIPPNNIMDINFILDSSVLV